MPSVEWNYLFIPKIQRFRRWSLGLDAQFYPKSYDIHAGIKAKPC